MRDSAGKLPPTTETPYQISLAVNAAGQLTYLELSPTSQELRGWLLGWPRAGNGVALVQRVLKLAELMEWGHGHALLSAIKCVQGMQQLNHSLTYTLPK